MEIDTARCHNCALCASACLTGTFQSDSLPRMDLLKQMVKAQHWSFACAPSGCEGDALVPCLGALDPVILAYLAGRGIAVELRGGEHCQECVHAPQGSAQLDLNLDGFAVLRETFGDGKWAPVGVFRTQTQMSPSDSDKPQVARRQFFRRVFGRAADTLVRAGDNEPVSVPARAIRAAAPLLPMQRELLQLLWPRGVEAALEMPVHPALPMAQLVVAPGCMACEACARVCPTGALQIYESTQSWTLVFQFARCVGCEVCLEACQPGVLYGRDPIAFTASQQPSAIQPLTTVPQRRCERCGRFYIAQGKADTCQVCADDGASFEAVFG